MNTVKEVLLYKLLELEFLTTEEEEYAVFTTTESKERFTKTHTFITDVNLFRFTYLFLRWVFGFHTDILTANSVS